MVNLNGLRILYVSRLWLPFAGGAELEGHHFVTKLIQEGAEVEVVCFYPHDAIDSAIDITYPITRLYDPDLQYTAGSENEYLSHHDYDANRARLFQFLSEGDEEGRWDAVIHFGDLGPADFNYSNQRQFTKWINIGRIWDPPTSLNKGWEDWPWRLQYDLTLFPTQYHVQATEHYNNEPAMTLPPAHIEVKENIDTLDGWEERPYDFGFINAIPHKGLNMVMKLIGMMPDKTFLIKRGNYHNQQMVEFMDKWYDNVTVAGWYDDMNDYYRSCKSILYPSLQEGFGMVSYEAMANGCLTFANSHPVMLSACPTGPIYIDAYPEESKQNYIRYQMTNTPQDHDAYMDLAAEEWHDEIREVLSDPERVHHHRTLGLEAMSTLGQRIDFCYSEFYDFLLSNLKDKSI